MNKKNNKIIGLMLATSIITTDLMKFPIISNAKSIVGEATGENQNTDILGKIIYMDNMASFPNALYNKDVCGYLINTGVPTKYILNGMQAESKDGVILSSEKLTSEEFTELLRSLELDVSDKQAEISISVGEEKDGFKYFEGNGHYYKKVKSTTPAYLDSLNLPTTHSLFGQKGYMPTINSKEEYDFINELLDGSSAFISGKKVDGVWKFNSGPENGTTMKYLEPMLPSVKNKEKNKKVDRENEKTKEEKLDSSINENVEVSTELENGRSEIASGEDISDKVKAQTDSETHGGNEKIGDVQPKNEPEGELLLFQDQVGDWDAIYESEYENYIDLIDSYLIEVGDKDFLNEKIAEKTVKMPSTVLTFEGINELLEIEKGTTVDIMEGVKALTDTGEEVEVTTTIKSPNNNSASSINFNQLGDWVIEYKATFDGISITKQSILRILESGMVLGPHIFKNRQISYPNATGSIVGTDDLVVNVVGMSENGKIHYTLDGVSHSEAGPKVIIKDLNTEKLREVLKSLKIDINENNTLKVQAFLNRQKPDEGVSVQHTGAGDHTCIDGDMNSGHKTATGYRCKINFGEVTKVDNIEINMSDVKGKQIDLKVREYYTDGKTFQSTHYYSYAQTGNTFTTKLDRSGEICTGVEVEFTVTSGNATINEIKVNGKPLNAETISITCGEAKLTTSHERIELIQGQKLPDITATATDYTNEDLTESIVKTIYNPAGEVVDKLGTDIGEWRINFSVTGTDDNVMTKDVIINIAPDTVAPVLTGVVPTKTIEACETFDLLEGITAEDDVLGVITNEIQTKVIKDGQLLDELEPSVPGVYTIEYISSDAANNMAKEVMVLTIEDTTAPVINGVQYRIVDIGTEVDKAFLLDGVTVYEVTDKNLIDQIEVSVKKLEKTQSGEIKSKTIVDKIDTSDEYSYEVTYRVADSAGHETEVSEFLDVQSEISENVEIILGEPHVDGEKITYPNATIRSKVGKISGIKLWFNKGYKSAKHSFVTCEGSSDSTGALVIDRELSMYEATKILRSVVITSKDNTSFSFEVCPLMTKYFSGVVPTSLTEKYSPAFAFNGNLNDFNHVNSISESYIEFKKPIYVDKVAFRVSTSSFNSGEKSIKIYGDGKLLKSDVLDVRFTSTNREHWIEKAIPRGIYKNIRVEFVNNNGDSYSSVVVCSEINIIGSPNYTEVRDEYDITNPVIKVKDPFTVEGGSSSPNISATATDDFDGTITSKIKNTIINPKGEEVTTIDTKMLGVWTVKYEVEDEAGNKANAETTFNVVDTTAPVINGVRNHIVNVGHDIDKAYLLNGANANDVVDYDVSDTVDVTFEKMESRSFGLIKYKKNTDKVDTSEEATYKLTYTARDKSGNIGERIQYLYVQRTKITTSHDRVELIQGQKVPNITATAKDYSNANLTNSIVKTIYNPAGEVVNEIDGSLGDWRIEFSVVDTDGDTISKDVIVNYALDTVNPIIKGVTDKTIEAGSKINLKQGVTATDDILGTITNKVNVSITKDGQVIEQLDTTILGEYTVEYSVNDASNNTATEQMTLTIEDTTAPVISGVQYHIVNVGSEIDKEFLLNKVKATDIADKDVTDRIEVSIKKLEMAFFGLIKSKRTVNKIDTSEESSYEVTYSVEDNSGNRSEIIEGLEVQNEISGDAEIILGKSHIDGERITFPDAKIRSNHGKVKGLVIWFKEGFNKNKHSFTTLEGSSDDRGKLTIKKEMTLHQANKILKSLVVTNKDNAPFILDADVWYSEGHDIYSSLKVSQYGNISVGNYGAGFDSSKDSYWNWDGSDEGLKLSFSKPTVLDEFTFLIGNVLSNDNTTIRVRIYEESLQNIIGEKSIVVGPRGKVELKIPIERRSFSNFAVYFYSSRYGAGLLYDTQFGVFERGDKHPNWATNSYLNDTTAPKLNINRSLEIEGGSSTPSISATATDDLDGTITSKIKTTIINPNGEIAESINTKMLGVWTVRYEVEDRAGNRATEEITVTVKDTTKPSITGLIKDDVYPLGEVIDYKKDIKANDKVDGDLSEEVEYSYFKREYKEDSKGNSMPTWTLIDEIDFNVAGDYKIVYSSTDKSNNTAKVVSSIKLEDMVEINLDLYKDNNNVSGSFEGREDLKYSLYRKDLTNNNYVLIKNFAKGSNLFEFSDDVSKVTKAPDIDEYYLYKGKESQIYVEVNSEEIANKFTYQVKGFNSSGQLIGQSKELSKVGPMNKLKGFVYILDQKPTTTVSSNVINNEDGKFEFVNVPNNSYLHVKGIDQYGKPSNTIHIPLGDDTYNNKPMIKTSLNKVLEAGEKFDPMDGVTAYDYEDGDLTEKITYSGADKVDTDRVGTYEVEYTVTDSNALSTTVTVKIHITGSMELTLTEGDNLIDLEWEEVKNASSYEIYRTDADGYDYKLLGEIKGNKYTDKTVVDVKAPVIEEIYEQYLPQELNGDSDKESEENKKPGTQLVIKPRDLASTYRYFVKAIDGKGEMVNSTEKKQGRVKSDLAGYSFTIDENENTEAPNKMATVDLEVIKNAIKGKDGYVLHVRAFDKAGNIGETVHHLIGGYYRTNYVPIIHGLKNRYTMVGKELDLLSGVTATDYEDGDITANIKVEHNIDYSTPGIYHVTYTIKDSDYNTRALRTSVRVVKYMNLDVNPNLENNNIELDWTSEAITHLPVYYEVLRYNERLGKYTIIGRTEDTKYVDESAKDIYGAIYKGSKKAKNRHGVITVTVDAEDTGVTHRYQVVARLKDDKNLIGTMTDPYSGVEFFKEGSIIGGIEGYSWHLSNVRDDIVDNTIDVTTNVIKFDPKDYAWLHFAPIDIYGNKTDEIHIMLKNIPGPTEKPVPNSLPVIKAEDTTVKFNSDFNPLDLATATDKEDGDLTKYITYTGEVDTSIIGEYSIEFQVMDSHGEIGRKKIKVYVIPETTPESLKSNLYIENLEEDFIYVNTPYKPMKGVKVISQVDGDITDKVEFEVEWEVVDGIITPNKIGAYIITYTVSDSTGLTAQFERILYVVEKDTPVPGDGLGIPVPEQDGSGGGGGSAGGSDNENRTPGYPWFNPFNHIKACIGSDVDVRAGMTAEDKEDGDLTDKIKISGYLNTIVPGIYPINFKVKDSDWYSAYTTRIVEIIECKQENPEGDLPTTQPEGDNDEGTNGGELPPRPPIIPNENPEVQEQRPVGPAVGEHNKPNEENDIYEELWFEDDVVEDVKGNEIYDKENGIFIEESNEIIKEVEKDIQLSQSSLNKNSTNKELKEKNATIKSHAPERGKNTIIKSHAPEGASLFEKLFHYPLELNFNGLVVYDINKAKKVPLKKVLTEKADSKSNYRYIFTSDKSESNESVNKVYFKGNDFYFETQSKTIKFNVKEDYILNDIKAQVNQLEARGINKFSVDELLEFIKVNRDKRSIPLVVDNNYSVTNSNSKYTLELKTNESIIRNNNTVDSSVNEIGRVNPNSTKNIESSFILDTSNIKLGLHSINNEVMLNENYLYESNRLIAILSIRAILAILIIIGLLLLLISMISSHRGKLKENEVEIIEA